MKNKLVTLLLAAVLLLSLVPAAGAEFSDIPDEDTAYLVAVLQSFGIVDGNGDGTFAPDAPLTRAQFCKLAVAASGRTSQTAAYEKRTLFNDVPGGEWYTSYVNYACTTGIINGYGDGSFGPEDSVTLAQALTMLIRALGYEAADVGSFWPADYISFAAELRLSEGVSLGSSEPITRAQAARLLVNTLRMNTKDGKPYIDSINTVAASVSDAIALSNSAVSESGETQRAKVYSNGEYLYYSQSVQIPDELLGSSGTLLLDSSGGVCGFLPDVGDVAEITLASATSGVIKATNGASYTVKSGTPLVYMGERSNYQTGYVNLREGCALRLYFGESGTISTVYAVGTESAGAEKTVMALTGDGAKAASYLARELGAAAGYTLYKNGTRASASELALYDVAVYDAAANAVLVSDVRITGVVEAVSPGFDAPERVTLSGAEYTVAESARRDFADVSLGGTVTLLLAPDGTVAFAETDSKYKTDMVGVLTQSGSGYTVTLPGGNYLSGEVSGAVEEKRLGSLVRVSATGIGKLYISALRTSTVSGKLDITAKTLGDYAIASDAAVYEWVGSGKVTRIALADVTWTETLASSYVSWAQTDASGCVDIILLNNVTGNCYTYGVATAGTRQTSLSGSVSTLSVTNSDGSTPVCTGGGGIRSGAFAGVAATGAGTVADAVLLKSVTVARSALTFDGYALVNDEYYPIAENVQVYNETTKEWYAATAAETALEQATAYSATLTLYYDRTPAQGGAIRVVSVK